MRRLTAILLVTAALATAACGDDDDEGATSAAAAADGDGPASGEPIPVGMVSPLSGPGASFGNTIAEAAQVYTDNVNEEGGIDGRPIELKVCDDRTDPTEGARCAQSLLNEDGVVAIIVISGGTTLAIGPIVAASEVPMIFVGGTAAATAPDSGFFDYGFRTGLHEKDGLEFLLDQVAADGHERIGIMTQEDAYGEGGVEIMEDYAEETGKVEIVEVATSPLDATDVSSQATRLRNADPDAVIMQLTPVGLAAAFVRAADDVGLTAQLYGNQGLGSDAFLEAAGASAEGVRVPLFLNADQPNDQQKGFLDLVEAAGKEVNGFGTVLGANAMIVVTAGLREAGGDADGPAIVEALESGIEIETLWPGSISYSDDDHEGLEADTLTMNEVTADGFVPVDEVDQ